MEPKKIALLVGALVIAAVTAIMAKSMFNQSAAPAAVAAPVAQTVPTGPEVLVATRALPVGTIIQPDSFRYQPWPKDLIKNAYYLKTGKDDIQALSGTVVRVAVSAGQPVTQGSLVSPGDRGFLAAALGPGMRAVTVSVSTTSGVAGFAFPGDRVDLVLTQSVGGDTGPALKTSETIVRNLRVLATDQRTVPEDEEGKKEVKAFSSITLEVTPRIAEKIAVAQSIGQLSLSLRSIADNTADLDRAIASGEVSVPEGTDPKTAKTALLAIATRPSDSNPTWVTGADVSRFQRRSVPTAAPSGASVSMASAGGSVGTAYSQGPVVRVARGNDVTVVPVGGK